jgi:hypothetical protein
MSPSAPQAVIEQPEAEQTLVRDGLLNQLESELLAEARDRGRRDDDGGAQMFTDI